MTSRAEEFGPSSPVFEDDDDDHGTDVPDGESHGDQEALTIRISGDTDEDILLDDDEEEDEEEVEDPDAAEEDHDAPEDDFEDFDGPVFTVISRTGSGADFLPPKLAGQELGWIEISSTPVIGELQSSLTNENSADGMRMNDAPLAQPALLEPGAKAETAAATSAATATAAFVSGRTGSSSTPTLLPLTRSRSNTPQPGKMVTSNAPAAAAAATAPATGAPAGLAVPERPSAKKRSLSLVSSSALQATIAAVNSAVAALPRPSRSAQPPQSPQSPRPVSFLPLGPEANVVGAIPLDPPIKRRQRVDRHTLAVREQHVRERLTSFNAPPPNPEPPSMRSNINVSALRTNAAVGEKKPLKKLFRRQSSIVIVTPESSDPLFLGNAQTSSPASGHSKSPLDMLSEDSGEDDGESEDPGKEAPPKGDIGAEAKDTARRKASKFYATALTSPTAAAPAASPVAASSSPPEKPPPRPPRKKTLPKPPVPPMKRFESTREMDLPLAGERAQVFMANAKHSNRRPPVLDEKDRLQKMKNKTPYRRIAFSDTRLVAGMTSLKVWSMASGDQLCAVSLPDTKITDVVFCPFQRRSGELTEVWIGNEQGKLFRADIARGTVIEVLGVHQSAISRLLVGEDRLLSMSMDGMLLLWTQRSPGEEVKTAKTQLVTSKSFVTIRPHIALLVGPREDLWIASYKTIEVFEATADGYVGPRHKLHVGVAASFVTCMTKSTDGKFVFTGHNDAKIVLWDALLGTQLVAIKMDKSTNRIQGLLGVGDRLWVGLEDGWISVLDASNRMELIKHWRAHKSSITSLTCGSALGSLVVASTSEVGNVHFWDGSLSWDHIDRSIKSLEPEFCAYTPTKIAVCSWNINATKPDELRDHQLVDWLKTLDDPDIIVVGLQEIVDLENASRNAKSFLKEFRATEDQAGVAWMPAIVDALSAAEMDHMLLLEWRQLVGLFMCLIVRHTIKSQISWLHCTAVKTGLAGLHGNKGAITMRFLLQDSSICLINAHLPAHQSQVNERNTDAGLILKEELFPPKSDDFDRISFVNGGDGAMALDHDVVVFFGDLNYRIDLPNERARQLVQEKNWKELYAHDQLNPVNNPRNPLRHFSEMKLDFAPTYKYDPGTDQYDTSEKKRIPAWCDRILWKGNGVRPLGYGRLEFTNSDHRPIWGCVEVSAKKVSRVSREPLFLGIRSAWYRDEALRVVRIKVGILMRRTGASEELCNTAITATKGNMEDAMRWLQDPANVF